MRINGKIVEGSDLDTPVSTEAQGVQIFNALKQHSKDDETAFVDVTNDLTIGYKKIFQLSLQIAHFLKENDYTAGDVLSVCSENHVNFFPPIFAGLFNGLVIAPMNNTYSLGELVHVTELTKPKIIFCSKSTFFKFVRLYRQKKIAHVKHIFLLEALERTFGNILVDENRFEPRHVQLDDTAVILFSSGTTGLAKGVMLSHRNINHRNAQVMHKELESPFRNNTLSVSPFYHAMALFFGMNLVILKIPLVFMQKFQEDVYLRTIQEFKITMLFTVPPLVVFLAKSPLVDKYDLSSVKEVSCGAAPLSKEMADAVKKRLNIVNFRQGYGMTETTLGVIITPPNELSARKTGSAGIVAANTQCIIRDPESGKWLGPNKVGELCFKGGNIMKGYYNNPQATTDAFTEDGWLKTGDLGYYDEDGYFYIVDRLKELIKYKGFQVPPSELESLLLSHPKVKEAAVVGLPDEKAGELPLAFIVKTPGATVTEAELTAFIAKKVSFAKRLHGGVRFIAAIPKNTSGKILRRLLRDSLKKRVSSKL